MDMQKRYTRLHRILHWTIALSMTVLLITGFLRMNWMSRRTIVSAIEKGTGPDSTLAKQQVTVIVKGIMKPMWQWHEYAAYLILSLFTIRIIYMLVKGIRFPNPFRKSLPLKERIQGSAYLFFYLFAAMATITGFYLKWGSGRWNEQMEAAHKWGLYWFPVFILIHMAGVLIGEFTNRKGVVSDMISGK